MLNPALEKTLQFGTAQEVRDLLAAGISILGVDESGDTAMYIAAERGDAEIVQILLQHQANIETVDAFRQKPLHIAAKMNHPEVVALLIAADAKLNARDYYGNTPLFCAINAGSLECVTHLVNAKASLEIRNQQGDSPVHRAVRINRNDILEFLISKNADVNLVNLQAETPLLLAVRKQATEIINTLLNNGAEKTSSNWHNENALHLAVRSKNMSSVRRLLEANIDKNATNENGFTPIALAYLLGRRTIVRILRNHGAVLPANIHQMVQQHQGNNLAAQAADPEGGIRPISNDQADMLIELKKRYRSKFDAPQTVLDQIAATLAQKYALAPAKDPMTKEALPLHYKASLTSQKPYYEHTIHSAWRYFLKPNPWISAKAEHAFQVNKKPDSAHISSEDKETIACLWLAAQQENCVDALIPEIAYLARTHNWEKYRLDSKTRKKIYYDDKNPDSPSCGIGVKKRLCDFMSLLPSFMHIHVLNHESFKQRFEEQLIAHNPDMPNNLAGKLKKLPLATLEALKAAIDDVYVMMEPLDEAHKQLITLQTGLVNKFLADCKTFYGAEKWKQRKDEPVNPSNIQSFKSYTAYANDLALNIADHCYERLNEVIENIILDKKKPVLPPPLEQASAPQPLELPPAQPILLFGFGKANGDPQQPSVPSVHSMKLRSRGKLLM